MENDKTYKPQPWCGSLSDVSSTVCARFLGLILLGGLALRLGWIMHLGGTPPDQALPDQMEYLQLARNLLKGQGLSLYDARFDDTVYAFRMPGYPLFLAGLGGQVVLIRIVQALIDTGTILAVFLLARRYLPIPAALVAGGMVAVHPYLIYFSGMILSETLFTAMLAWAMLLLVPVSGQPRVLWVSGRWMLGVVMLAWGVLVRPSALFLPVMLGSLASLMYPPVGERPQYVRRVIFSGLACGGLTLLILLPWAVRNAHHPELGEWIWTTTNGGVTLYDGFHPAATGASDQRFLRDMPELRGMNEVERSAYLSGLAWEQIKQDPLRAFRLGIRKVYRTLSPVPLSQEHGSDPIYLVAGLGVVLPILLLGLLGAVWGNIPGSVKVFCFAPLVYFTLIHALSVGSLRYRVPADVPLTLPAAAMVARGLNRSIGDQDPCSSGKTL